MDDIVNKYALARYLIEELGDVMAEADEILPRMVHVLKPTGTLHMRLQLTVASEEEPFTGLCWNQHEKTVNSFAVETFTTGFVAHFPHLGESFLAGESPENARACLEALGVDPPSSYTFLNNLIYEDTVDIFLREMPYLAVDENLRQLLLLSGTVREFEFARDDFGDMPPFWNRPELMPQIGDVLVRVSDPLEEAVADDDEAMTVESLHLYSREDAEKLFRFC